MEVRAHWQVWYKAQQDTITTSLEAQRSAIAPVHEGVLPALDAVADLIPLAEDRQKELRNQLETARRANDFGSTPPAEAGQAISEFDRLEREARSVEQVLGFVRDTVAGLDGLSRRVIEFRKTIDDKLAEVRA